MTHSVTAGAVWYLVMMAGAALAVAAKAAIINFILIFVFVLFGY